MAHDDNFNWDEFCSNADMESFMLPPAEDSTLERGVEEVLYWEQIASLDAVINAPSPTAEPFDLNSRDPVHTTPHEENVTTQSLNAQMKLLMQKLEEHVRVIDEVKAEVEQTSKTVNGLAVMNGNAITANEQNSLRVDNLKAVYDELVPWTFAMYHSIQEVATRQGFVVNSSSGPSGR